MIAQFLNQCDHTVANLIKDATRVLYGSRVVLTS